jgi:hypothetical protein
MAISVMCARRPGDDAPSTTIWSAGSFLLFTVLQEASFGFTFEQLLRRGTSFV